jgi:hypothetical protein
MIKLITGYFPKKNINNINRNEINLDTTLLDIFTLTCVSFSIAVYLRVAGSNSALYGPERVAFQLAFIFSLPIAILIDSFLRSSRLTHRIGLFALLFSSFIFQPTT